jgi:hypothetical protein
MYRALLPAAALAALALAPLSARADLIQWGYNWKPKVSTLTGSLGGKVSLTDEPAKAASGNSNTVVTNIHAFSSGTVESPDQFNHAAYAFTLTLTDVATHQSGTLAFTGYLNGTVTAASSNLTNTFTGLTTQQLVLGGNVYSVAIDQYSPPGPPGAVNAGSIDARVNVHPQITPPPVHDLPEPSGLALAGLGLAGGAAWRWRRRRAR